MSRREKLRSKGLKHVLNESSISNIIRQLRLLNKIAKHGKTDKEWDKMVEKYSYINYSDLDSPESSAEKYDDPRESP